jgi:hypothetical protein
LTIFEAKIYAALRALVGSRSRWDEAPGLFLMWQRGGECEMWQIRRRPGEGPREALLALLAQRRLNEHPDRVETRAAWAVTQTGKLYSAILERGSDVAEAASEAPGVGGMIPDSLRRLMHAFISGAN